MFQFHTSCMTELSTIKLVSGSCSVFWFWFLCAVVCFFTDFYLLCFFCAYKYEHLGDEQFGLDAAFMILFTLVLKH